MNVNKIIHNEKVLAVIIRSEDWSPGLNFVTNDQDFIQVGLWNYQSGKKLGPHKHVNNVRQISRTQEMIFVKKGCVQASIFSENNELVKKEDLNAGDLMVVFSGGHGYKILEEGTHVLEVKNGPFTGLDDRINFDDSSI